MASVISVCARLGTRWAMARKLFLDDILIIVAQVCHILSRADDCPKFNVPALLSRRGDFDIIFIFQWSRKLARHPHTGRAKQLSEGMIRNLVILQSRPRDLASLCIDTLSLKAEYSAVPFFILTLATVKWSISVFISQLTPGERHIHSDMGLRVLVGLWLLCGAIVSIFQCAIPRPWDYTGKNHCIDRVGVIPSIFHVVLTDQFMIASLVGICGCDQRYHRACIRHFVHLDHWKSSDAAREEDHHSYGVHVPSSVGLILWARCSCLS